MGYLAVVSTLTSVEVINRASTNILCQTTMQINVTKQFYRLFFFQAIIRFAFHCLHMSIEASAFSILVIMKNTFFRWQGILLCGFSFFQLGLVELLDLGYAWFVTHDGYKVEKNR